MTELQEPSVESRIETALLDYVSNHEGATPTAVIPEISHEFGGAQVRRVYWKLVSESRIHRSPEGRLTTTASP